MQTIGLIGGMSAESSQEYYRLINRETARRLGPGHNARSVMVTLDFADIQARQHAGDWDGAAEQIVVAAGQAQAAGAAFLVLCTNTMHAVLPRIEGRVGLPFLHIADATGQALRGEGLSRVALLGTRFTMEQPFYHAHLRDHFGIESIIPAEAEREAIHRIIFDELTRGIFTAPSRERYAAIIDRLAREEAAEAAVLACTEIGLLIQPGSATLPLFDTTRLHAAAAVERALNRPAES
jgi:aspartate racemase